MTFATWRRTRSCALSRKSNGSKRSSRSTSCRRTQTTQERGLGVRAGTGRRRGVPVCGRAVRSTRTSLATKASPSRWFDVAGSKGGVKEVVATVEGHGAWLCLSGKRRAPCATCSATEAQGRIHTSTVTVAVLIEPDDVDVVLNDKDIRVDTYRAGALAVSTSTRRLGRPHDTSAKRHRCAVPRRTIAD